ncbi:MAG: TetR/AcrR family transcriptional regulator [Firmicutes bacterium]|nr:TetR/AcrR family transcriptional regulator [Bacillota bacterium]MDD6979620.1 TetR/AcrR family transcriptional regulator [Bacillota bacterium]MDY6174448.1 TetR/AcrR family transcriptional regulator [Lentihominibacter sp.]
MGKQGMTTKERIVDEALTLFASKGFRGTTVKDIADAVGIKDASLYKHFKSKKEILNTIVEEAYVHMGNMSDSLGIPSGDGSLEDAAEFFRGINRETIIALGKEVFKFYLTDGYMSRFWKLANLEQYNNRDFYELYRRLFTEEGIEYQKNLFAEMIRMGAFREGDPEVMAYNFYSPIFLLLHRYAGSEGELDEALEIIEKMVGDFYDRYQA